MGGAFRRDPLTVLAMQQAFGALRATPGEARRISVPNADWEPLLLSDGPVTAEWVDLASNFLAKWEALLNESGTPDELDTLGESERVLVGKIGRLQTGWEKNWSECDARRELVKQIRAEEQATEALETQLNDHKRPVIFGKKKYDLWRGEHERSIEKSKSSLNLHRQRLSDFEEDEKTRWQNMTACLPDLLAELEALRIRIKNVSMSRDVRRKEISDLRDRIARGFVCLLQLALEPLATLPAGSSQQQAFVHSVASSGFIDLFTGVHCATIHATAASNHSKAYARAMLLLGQTNHAFATEEGWNPTLDVGGKTVYCSDLLSGPVRRMLDVTNIPDVFGRVPDFYRGAALVLILEELADVKSARRLHGYRAGMALASIGLRLARADKDASAVSNLEQMTNSIWQVIRQGARSQELAEHLAGLIQGCVKDGTLITR